MKYICCICGKEKEGYGNNPEPVVREFENGKRNRCCDNCNKYIVVPARLDLYGKSEEEL